MVWHNLVHLGHNLLSNCIWDLLVYVSDNAFCEINFKMWFEVGHFILEILLNVCFDTPLDILGESVEALLNIQIDLLRHILNEVFTFLQISLQLLLMSFTCLEVLNFGVEVLDYILGILRVLQLLFFYRHVHLVHYHHYISQFLLINIWRSLAWTQFSKVLDAVIFWWSHALLVLFNQLFLLYLSLGWVAWALFNSIQLFQIPLRRGSIYGVNIQRAYSHGFGHIHIRFLSHRRLLLFQLQLCLLFF